MIDPLSFISGFASGVAITMVAVRYIVDKRTKELYPVKCTVIEKEEDELTKDERIQAINDAFSKAMQEVDREEELAYWQSQFVACFRLYCSALKYKDRVGMVKFEERYKKAKEKVDELGKVVV